MRWPVTARGFDGDREFAFLDDAGRVLTQRRHPRLATVDVAWDGTTLTFGTRDRASSSSMRATSPGADAGGRAWERDRRGPPSRRRGFRVDDGTPRDTGHARSLHAARDAIDRRRRAADDAHGRRTDQRVVARERGRAERTPRRAGAHRPLPRQRDPRRRRRVLRGPRRVADARHADPRIAAQHRALRDDPNRPTHGRARRRADAHAARDAQRARSRVLRPLFPRAPRAR